jgi:hypothetical protein
LLSHGRLLPDSHSPRLKSPSLFDFFDGSCGETHRSLAGFKVVNAHTEPFEPPRRNVEDLQPAGVCWTTTLYLQILRRPKPEGSPFWSPLNRKVQERFGLVWGLSLDAQADYRVHRGVGENRVLWVLSPFMAHN